MNKIKIADAWCLSNNGYELYGRETDRLTKVTPSERQLEFLDMKYYNFIHFGVNTFYNREWGDGKEKLKKFNPKRLDTDQWCEILKGTGSKGVIITAKHHDGFCLFDTKYTQHNVMNTPFGKDIVKMLSESCKKYGLKLGIYLSPWDRHEETYGTESYNDFFVNQLTELCQNYGEVFTFWFDGACGEGKNGKKQIYDWDRYYSTIRKYQPDAVITICGPDVRWIGNEGGKVRECEWSVIPAEKDSNSLIMENSQTDAKQLREMAEKLDDCSSDLGSRKILRHFRNLVFKPAEADISITYGWFYHDTLYYFPRFKRSAKYLSEVFFNTVGGNASMLLNVPPNTDGLISEREIETLNEFTRLIKAPFRNPITDGRFSMLRLDGKVRPVRDGYFDFDDDETGIKVTIPEGKKLISIYMEEDLKFSQRVEEFKVYAKYQGDGAYYEIYSGTVIGSGKIIRFPAAVGAEEIIITPTQTRKNPILKKVLIFAK
ncbi:MAG: alpha-L-fucosidase [Clostridia bacterium]|nr:alpha-L-fucosidase [Clostridia bacterium]